HAHAEDGRSVHNMTVKDFPALTVIGILLILFGVVSILIGDRKLPIKGGTILRFFSTSPRIAKWRKWVIGLGSIYAGAMFLHRAGLLF
ncbi:MAG: hypothetical protein KGJ55_12415, partial [Gammaproteobacteria bacterium]|nr:hypothetical protein [Gammaproteobacteria bacterium]